MIGRFVWRTRMQVILIGAFAMWAAPALAQSAGAVRPASDLPGMNARPVQEAVAVQHSLHSFPVLAPLLTTQGTNGLSLAGSVHMQINGSTVRLTVDKVENTSLTRTSGTLRLNLWLSSVSYRGLGYSTAVYTMGQLSPNTYFGPIDQTVSFSEPPAGCYYVTLFLEELQSSGAYGYADYVDFVCTSMCDATGTRVSINGGCNSSPSPNLTPYQTSGWSDKVVVTTTSGSRTDAPTIRPTDTVYVNFGVINNGSAATSARFYTAILVDGTTVQTFYADPPLNSNFFVNLVDYSLGPLSAGTHTIAVAADSTGVIAESNESDNTYSKTVIVSADAQPDLVPQDVSLSSASLPIGGSLTVKVTVKNQGAGDAAATTTLIRLNSNPLSSNTSDPIQKGVPTPPITAGSSTVVSANFTLNTPGTYYAHVYVDSNVVLSQRYVGNDAYHTGSTTVSAGQAVRRRAATPPKTAPLESATRWIVAAAGGTITLPSGGSATIPAGALSSDQMVTLWLVAGLPQQPPSTAIKGLGPALSLTFSTNRPFPSAAQTQGIQFVLKYGSAVPPGLGGSLPITDVVDEDNFVGLIPVPCGSESSCTVVPLAMMQDLPVIRSINVSPAIVTPAIDLAPLPKTGAKSWNGTNWVDGVGPIDPSKKYVVLVHGMNSSVEEAYRDRNSVDGDRNTVEGIRRAGGYDAVIGFDYEWKENLTDSGTRLSQFLTSLRSAGITQVDIEAHSEGGPVALAASCFNGDMKIANIVLLGAPVMGTPAAFAGPVVQSGTGTLIAINPLLTVLANLRTGVSLSSSGQSLQEVVNSPVASDLQPLSESLRGFRTCVAQKMRGNSNLASTHLTCVAGTDYTSSPDMWKLGTILAWLFNGETFDGIVNQSSANCVGAGFDPNKVTALSYPVSHTQLASDIRVIAAVGNVVKGITTPTVSFAASPATITKGQFSTLTWTTTNATSVSISGVGAVQPLNGNVPVSPAATTTYTLTATGPAGTATATATVTVTSPPSQCNASQVAGGDAPETRTIEMGRSSGTFTFSYDTYFIEDRMVVSYEGRTLFDTGCVGASASKILTYSGTSTRITVQVTPNCTGQFIGTAWTFTVGCPN